MRILKKLLLTVGSVAVLLLLVAGGLITYASIDKEDAFFINNAGLMDPDYLRSLGSARSVDPSEHQERYSVYAHRLKRGKGTIFANRFYSNGKVFVGDDEIYRKLTIWIASDAAPPNVDLDLGNESEAIVIFSRGGSAWPDNGCAGYVSSGHLHIERSGTHYLVGVRGTLEPSGTLDIWKQCSAQQIEINFSASQVNYEQLTPWLGIAGSHPYQETYR